MNKISLAILVVLIMTLQSIYAQRSEIYSEFAAARNATAKSTLGVEYYSKEQFARLGDVANRLYIATNQDETVSSLRRENKELQAQLEALNSKIQAIEKPKEVIPQHEMKSSKVVVEPIDDDEPIVKQKSLTNWLFDNGLLLLLILGGGAYFVSQKRNNNYQKSLLPIVFLALPISSCSIIKSLKKPIPNIVIESSPPRAVAKHLSDSTDNVIRNSKYVEAFLLGEPNNDTTKTIKGLEIIDKTSRITKQEADELRSILTNRMSYHDPESIKPCLLKPQLAFRFQLNKWEIVTALIDFDCDIITFYNANGTILKKDSEFGRDKLLIISRLIFEDFNKELKFNHLRNSK